MQGHLAAFEANLVETTRTRLLTLVTTASRLAQARTNTATNAALGVLGAISGLQVIQLHALLRLALADDLDQ
eukprot:11355-Eustigmatos_ZCMA.PRE.1